MELQTLYPITAITITGSKPEIFMQKSSPFLTNCKVALYRGRLHLEHGPYRFFASANEISILLSRNELQLPSRISLMTLSILKFFRDNHKVQYTDNTITINIGLGFAESTGNRD